MKTVFFTLFVLLLLSVMPFENAEAQRTVVRTPRRTVVHSPRGTVVYRHRPVVRPVAVMPHTAVVVHYRNSPYYYNAGAFYLSRAGAYVRVVPPVGIRVAVLPAGFTRVYVGTAPFFFYGGVFYTATVANEFEVVPAPVGAIVEALPEDVADIELDGQACVEYNGIIYRPVFRDGRKYYEVVGSLDK